MEKLIELLNKYEEKKEKYVWSEYDLCYRPDRIILAISKHYGFIERLVENDKIDFELPIETLSFREYYDIKKSDFLIMILSIQYNPIDYLCSILKE